MTPINLRELLAALDAAVIETVSAPRGKDIGLRSAVLVDADDLDAEIEPPQPVPDIYVLVGVAETDARDWLARVAGRVQRNRPSVVMVKRAGSPVLRAAAAKAGIALVAVDERARWDHIFPLVQQLLTRSTRGPGAADDGDLLAAETDLFELAQVVAANAGGLVSIEDGRSKVLAYSSSDGSADELRRLSILGREGPRAYLDVLERLGVFSRLRETDDVIEVPPHDELGTRRRLVVSIRESSASTVPSRLLGSIWLQQGDGPFTPDAADVLRGASAVAARLIARSLNAPTTEGLLTQRLFGLRGGGVDIPTVATALGLATSGPAAVVGFALPALDSADAAGFPALGRLIRLHASSFRRDAVATVLNSRAYVLLPQYSSARGVSAWARHLVDQFEKQRALSLRAAIALPLADLAQVAAARTEVDRVLDATAETFPAGRVTTLAESLTPVLLGEILDLIVEHSELADPRLAALDDYDSKSGGELRASAGVYLGAFGDIRGAAATLNIHPNTLRYRLRRVEEILGISLANPSDRLLLDLQLAAGHRRLNRPTAI